MGRLAAAVAIAGLIAACGGSAGEAGSGAGTGGGRPGAGGGATAGGEIVGEGRARGELDGRRIEIALGFVPDPRVVEGEASGRIDAATLGADCVGFLAEEPDHELVVAEAMPELHVLASSPFDVTLVVRRPDGTVLCNDDFQETNPKVTLAPAAAGTYAVWVGNYEDGGDASAYHLGVTTLATVTPALLVPGEEEQPLDLGDGSGGP